MQQPKVRNSNLELYRIIVMLLIVTHHYVVNSGLMTLMDALLNPLLVFCICSIIEYIRMKTVEQPLLEFVYRKIRG